MVKNQEWFGRNYSKKRTEFSNQLLAWRQRHIEDVRERNSRISELEEQIAQMQVNPN